MFPDRIHELAYRIDLLDFSQIELEVELALDAADDPDMRKAVPSLQVDLARIDADGEIIIIEFGAENLLQPLENGRLRGVGDAVHQIACPVVGTNSSLVGTGSMYMVIPFRPSATACSMNGLASAANIFKLESFASVQISGPKCRRSRCGRTSPPRLRNSCSPASPFARFQRYRIVPLKTCLKKGTSS